MRSRIMNNLLTAFVVLSTLPSSHADFDITSNVTIHPDTDFNFIQIEEGTSIEVICMSTMHTGHSWKQPDNKDVKGFANENRDARVRFEEGHDPLEQRMFIATAKPWDTGLYECIYDGGQAASVYLFVRGSKFFLQNNLDGFKADDSFTVPCRSTYPPLDEEGRVELYMEGDLMKDADKHYDPRFGFEVTHKMYSKLKGSTKFECKYNDEMVTYVVTQRKTVDEIDFDVRIIQNTDFPYVGGSLNFSCLVEGESVYANAVYHKVWSKVPRHNTSDPKDIHYKYIHRNANEILNFTTVEHLTSEDSGEYVCEWYREGENGFELKKNATKIINISKTMEQIRFLDHSPQLIEIMEGSPLHIFCDIELFPAKKPYSATWKQLYRDAFGTARNSSNLVINEDGQSVYSLPIGEGKYKEVVNATSVSYKNAGYYQVEIKNEPTKLVLEYVVRIQSRKLYPFLHVTAPDQWVLLDQDYYKTGSILDIVCYIEGYPHATTTFLSREIGSSDWTPVEGAEIIEGTYSIGFRKTHTATDNIEFKCSGERETEKVSTTKEIIVSDQQANVVVSWSHAEDTGGQQRKQLFEGDTVVLDCVVPDSSLVTTWYNNAKPPAVLKGSRKNSTHGLHHYVTIESAVVSQSGTYTCLVTDPKKNNVTFTATLDVIPTAKPFLKTSLSEPHMDVKYGETLDLQCDMNGTPAPNYKWLKDGVELTEGVTEGGSRLHIARAGKEDDGKIVCRAYNRAGITDLNFFLKVKGVPNTLSRFNIIMLILIISGLIIAFIIAILLYTRQRKKAKERARSIQLLYDQLMRGEGSDAPPLPLHGKVTMDMRVRRTAYDAKYEIELQNLVIMEVLGMGQFGSVRKGKLVRGSNVSDSSAYRGPALTVAIKAPRNGNNPEDQKALIDELKILIAIDNLDEEGVKHPNVLSLVGAVTRNMKDGQLFVVCELCEHGDLKTFLQKYKGDFKDRFINQLREVKDNQENGDDYLVPNNQSRYFYTSLNDPENRTLHERDRLIADPNTLSTSDLISFSMQVASGMDFLSSVSCIHRDLAARNCLLTTNRVVKIADFGMAKNEDKGYYRMQQTNVMVPYRWMAPETMEDHKFSVESDIWSFGIVMYEIFTLGSQPYPGVPNNNLHEHLKAGHRNPRPELCHPDIYNLMVRTWDKDSQHRPTFYHCMQFMRVHLERMNPELLDSVDSEIARNCAQIAQFDHFRGPRSAANLHEREAASMYASQLTPVNGARNEETNEERIYIKELRR